MSPSKPIKLASGRISHTTTVSNAIDRVNDTHKTSDDFIIVMLMIAVFVSCCTVVSCIMAKCLMNKNKEKCQNDHHDQSTLDISGVKNKVNHINNLVDIQRSNIVNLDDSGCSNDNDMPITSIQSTAITTAETLGDHDRYSKMKRDGIRLWLESISFSEYFSNFVLSGYESIEFIQEIQNELELQEIGISSESECRLILLEIEKLRNVANDKIKDGIAEPEIVDDHTRTTNVNEYMQNEGESSTGKIVRECGEHHSQEGHRKLH